jgi:lysophospholipase L1-like esterase
LLAGWIAEAAARPVRLTCPAVVGSLSAWLAGQVETVLEAGTDLAIIFIGANDVTGRASAAAAARHLAEAVHDLRATGAEVVVATCPDLGTVQPIQPPLRWLARRWSRQLAEAQTLAVLREGGRTVSLGDLVSPAFGASPQTMFGDDRFHPSAAGYREAANAVLPTALAALGLAAADANGRPVPLTDAAALAAKRPGTSVQPDGRWAWIRRYASRIRPQPAPATAARQASFAVPSLSGELASPSDG